MKALGISQQQNLESFICTQSYYALAGRDIERDTIPLIDDQGLGLLVWSPLAGGFLSGKFTRDGSNDADARRTSFDFPPIDKSHVFDIIDAMRPIAQAHNASVAQVALAWLLAKRAVTSIIIGAKRMEQLDDNLGAIDLELTKEETAQLDEVSATPVPYPAWMHSLGDDRLPGTARDLAAMLKKSDSN